MTEAIINRFDGGKAEDIRTTSTNQCTESFNFDLYTNPHKLSPFRDTVLETVDSGDMDDIQISDVGTSNIAGAVYLTACGYASSVSSAPAFYTRSSGMNGLWVKQATGTGTFQKGTMVTYQEKAYCIAKDSSTQYSLQRYNSAGSVTTIGTITVPVATGSDYVVPRPFMHPEDKCLYVVVGNVIGKLSTDVTTFTTVNTILPTGFTATSITDYGAYLAISVKPQNGIGSSIAYLWGRDLTLNTLQGTIDFGEGDLNVIENIGNSLVGLVYSKYYGSYNSVISNRVDIKVYAGGAVQTVKSINTGLNGNFNILKLKNAEKLYFGFGAYSQSIWCVYQNKESFWTVNEEKFVYNGSTSTADLMQNLQGLSAIGDYFYIGFNDNVGNYRLTATSITTTAFSNTSTYKTTINPNMYLNDRYKDKDLLSVRIAVTGTIGGTIKLKYSADGSTMTSLISETTVITNGTELVYEASTETDGKPLLNGREFQFQVESTGNVKIKEIAYYYKTLTTQQIG